MPAWWGDRGVFAADVNGDGKADLSVIDNDKVYISKSLGSSFGARQAWTATPYFGDSLR
jgi:hypothetical protein